jgi:hypothetical protein
MGDNARPRFPPGHAGRVARIAAENHVDPRQIDTARRPPQRLNMVEAHLRIHVAVADLGEQFGDALRADLERLAAATRRRPRP